MIWNRVIYGKVTTIDLIIVVALFSAAFGLVRLINYYLFRKLKDKSSKHTLDIFRKTTATLLYSVALISALPYLGLKLSGLIVAGGITGVVVAFASQNIVSNLISGLFLLIEHPIKIGQAVQIDQITGIVENISIIATIIRTYDGLYVRVPNSRVFTQDITNYVNNIVRRLDLEIGIRYSNDAERALDTLRQVIDAEPRVLINPEPMLYVKSLDDSAVTLGINVWAPVTEWFPLRRELLLRLKLALEAAGFEIPFPQRTVWLARASIPGDQSPV